jgi:hypothetical protein
VHRGEQGQLGHGPVRQRNSGTQTSRLRHDGHEDNDSFTIEPGPVKDPPVYTNAGPSTSPVHHEPARRNPAQGRSPAPVSSARPPRRNCRPDQASCSRSETFWTSPTGRMPTVKSTWTVLRRERSSTGFPEEEPSGNATSAEFGSAEIDRQHLARVSGIPSNALDRTNPRASWSRPRRPAVHHQAGTPHGSGKVIDTGQARIPNGLSGQVKTRALQRRAAAIYCFRPGDPATSRVGSRRGNR